MIFSWTQIFQLIQCLDDENNFYLSGILQDKVNVDGNYLAINERAQSR